jgi:fructose-specific component phosphotransferase system IIB-like protein
MIFGFNTDIKHEDTVYHVQSEAREGEHLLQTQVFVRGRCVGKRAVPYSSGATEGTSSEKVSSPDPRVNSGNNNDQDKEKRLRELHREVLEAIRDGKLDSILDKRETLETLAAVKELDLQWVNGESVYADGALNMKIRVTDGGAAIAGARLTLRFARPDAAPYYAQVLTDAKGDAEMGVQVEEKSLADSTVVVQVNFEGRTATRKFELREYR